MAPQYPAGPLETIAFLSPDQRQQFIDEIRQVPAELRQLVVDLGEVQLDTLYRNWTIRQIAHHIADSHANCYIRFKWTLTEDRPTIKAYNETAWSALTDSRTGDVQPALLLLEGLHARWVQLLETLSVEQFAREFFHPESAKWVTLDGALQSYAWHGRHHLAQIRWLRNQHGW